MNTELSRFAARLRDSISIGFQNCDFDTLALELFALQFKHNAAYQKICEARGQTPETVEHWSQIPAVPTTAFKELDLTSLAPNARAAVFHSSGTTTQTPSRHFHSAESLALYEESLWVWFSKKVFQSAIGNRQSLIFLTPPPELAPNSSLVHMFETIRQKLGGASVPTSRIFFGEIAADGTWNLNFEKALATLENPQSAIRNPQLILGTAFSFVHLLDFLAKKNLKFELPKNSRVLETGGYKNRSRSMSKTELHSLIEKFLGVPRENIVCEYSMSELSSQAYQTHHSSLITHHFAFPPWARAQIISPETGHAVADGETGLIRIFDLANVFSVAAIQTEDLAVRRGDGFELIGRTQFAEPRGCSLMSA